LTTAEKLRDANDEIELLKIAGISEDKARDLIGQQQSKLPGEETYQDKKLFEAVREVVVEMVSGKVVSEDEHTTFRTVETLLADKLRENERVSVRRETTTETSNSKKVDAAQ